MKATAVVRTLVRPKVVSDFQNQRVQKERLKLRIIHILKWVITLSAGWYVAMQPRPHDHALTNLQKWWNRKWDEFFVTGAGYQMLPPPQANDSARAQDASAVSAAAAAAPSSGKKPEMK
jgi:hypothetical protein